MLAARYLVSLVISTTITLAMAQTAKDLIRRTPEGSEQERRAERKVTLDVQVTDTAGHAVHGLGSGELALLDQGKAQPLTAFREMGREGAAPAKTILLLDTMNASFQDVVIERQGINAFLRENGGHLSQPTSIAFLTDTGLKINKPSQDGNSLAGDLANLTTPVHVFNSAQGANGALERAKRSLHALEVIATYEGAKPGRKILIWIGPGWPLLSRSTVELTTLEHARYFHAIVDATTELRRAHMTVYNVAPLNLSESDGHPLLYQAYLKGIETARQADTPFLGLQVLAVHSGGLVFIKNGDLAGEISRCVADGQAWYEIVFDAPDMKDIQYHALQVMTNRGGTTVRTSTGYYAGIPQATMEAAAPVF